MSLINGIITEKSSFTCLWTLREMQSTFQDTFFKLNIFFGFDHPQ